MKIKKKLRTVLDLYCGLGGLSLGFEFTKNFSVIAGIDNYEPAVKTFYSNNECETRLLKEPKDMSTLEPKEVLDDLGVKPDVIVGGPPCQGFSDAGRRLEDLKHDIRNFQILHFFRFIEDIMPQAFVLENVSGILRTGQQKKHELIDMLVRFCKDLGYLTNWKVLNTASYRVPQNRKRFIMVGILGKEFRFPDPVTTGWEDMFGEEQLTVFDALSDLPTPQQDEPQPYEIEPRTKLQKFLRKSSDSLYNHLPTIHSDEMVERLQAQRIGTRLYSNWNHSWYRLDPNRPSPAVKENHRAPFVHYAEPRAVSPRECARLQTVPDRYVLKGTKTAQLIMIGNAVPPVFSAHLATAIAEQAFSTKPRLPWSNENNPLMDY